MIAGNCSVHIPDSVLWYCAVLGMCPFLLCWSFHWHIIVLSNSLLSFVLLLVVTSLFTILFFIYFYFFIFKLYNIVLVLPNIKMNPPQVYMCSPSWTLLPPPSPYHPSGSSQCTSPKHPVSFLEPGLATRFIHDIIHVSMPFSQIFPPSPSPESSHRVHKTVLNISVSFAVSYTGLLLPSF